jgi:hypothetical protein
MKSNLLASLFLPLPGFARRGGVTLLLLVFYYWPPCSLSIIFLFVTAHDFIHGDIMEFDYHADFMPHVLPICHRFERVSSAMTEVSWEPYIQAIFTKKGKIILAVEQSS